LWRYRRERALHAWQAIANRLAESFDLVAQAQRDAT
jgi:hypothetical protein